MTFAARLSRCPIAFDAAQGAEAAAAYSDQPGEIRDLIGGTAGCSPYLRVLLGREGEWLREALADDPYHVVSRLLSQLEPLPPKQMTPHLRQAKRRLALFVALADLGGVWQLEDVTQALTDFADRSVSLALKVCLEGPLSRGKLPGQGIEDLDTAAGMFVLAMGKMGAGELNYSSDIDLICLFDDARYPGAEAGDARAVFVRVVRQMAAMLSDQTGDGYVWRTDLRLRPDPSVTPVVLSMEAAERYYESLGRTWERAAHIKARPCAGDLAAGASYLDRLRPFIWRRHLDFAAVQDAHDMRLKIRRHKGLYAGDVLEGRDLKLGPGGIREIEFFTQTRQIISGGRDPDLRVRGTVPGLAVLARKGWISPEVAKTMTAHYRAFREIEHRVQMVSDARTHALPATGEGLDRIARMCGEADTSRFRREMLERLQVVQAEAEGFFQTDSNAFEGELEALDVPKIVDGWHRYPALRSDRARASFARIQPDLIARLNAAAVPDQAFAAFDGFLSGLPAGVQLFALFEANPPLRALICDIAATSPALARYLSRHSGVLDAVIGGDFFAAWPGREALTDMLASDLSGAPDYEAKLDLARRWAREWHFRIGVHLLRGLIDPSEAGAEYSELAEAVLKALFPAVEAQFAEKHGRPPGRGAAVIGMGSLGGGWLNARSDLDLLLIYDPAGEDSSDGRRPLATRAYYARLTQALVTALGAATAEGRLYEVDMRLRPSGRQGPVATSLAAFARYQREEAWTWEHLALTRARWVAGSEAVGRDTERVRREVLSEHTRPASAAADVSDMRSRLADAKAPSGPLDVKSGAGGLRDVELMGQLAALLAGVDARVASEQVNALGLAPVECSEGDVAAVQTALKLQQAVVAGTRLLLDAEPGASDALAEGAASVLARLTGAHDLADLRERLLQAQSGAAEVIDRTLARLGEKER